MIIITQLNVLQEKVAVATIVLLRPRATATPSQESTRVVLGPSRACFLVPTLNASVLPSILGLIKWVNLEQMRKHSLKPRNLV